MAYGQYSNPYMMSQASYNGYPNMGYQGNGSYGYQPPMNNFQPPMQNYGYQQQAPTQQQIATTMAYVNGDIEARAYAVAPGNRVYLFDMDGRTFYSKGVDHNGMPLPFKTYEYTEVVETLPATTPQSYGAMQEPVQQQPQINLDEYIKRDEVESMIAVEVEKRLAAMSKGKKGGEANAQ